MDPAPIDKTNNALAIPEVKPNDGISGDNIHAVVIIATVDDPCTVLIAAAMRKGSHIPSLASDNALPRVSAREEFCKTLPKAPPAPVIKIIIAA